MSEPADREGLVTDKGVCQCRQCVMQRERDEARATIERVKAARHALIALRDKAAMDADAGYRGSECYSDAYENVDRLIRDALEEKP